MLYFSCSQIFYMHIGKRLYFLLSSTCCLSNLCHLLVLERPTSQMSYLEHFLKETTSSTRHGSVDSVEGDIEDNRAPSITSSKSNLSELSIVSILTYVRYKTISRYKHVSLSVLSFSSFFIGSYFAIIP